MAKIRLSDLLDVGNEPDLPVYRARYLLTTLGRAHLRKMDEQTLRQVASGLVVELEREEVWGHEKDTDTIERAMDLVYSEMGSRV